MLQKLKNKFDLHCDHNFELPLDQFALLYSRPNDLASSSRGEGKQAQTVRQLYQYYTDLGQSRLNLKKFITKYATLWKS